MSSSTETVIYMRLPKVLHRKLKLVASENRRSLTAEAQIALERHVQAEKEKSQ